MRLRRIIDDFDRMGGEIYYRKEKYKHDPELMEAYECGFADAMRKVYDEDGYHERRGNVTHWGGDGSRLLYRRDDRDRMYDDEDDIQWRRRRRANGQFY